MSRKKTPDVTPDPETPDRVTVFNLKGTGEYKAWLDELSEFCHLPTASLFDVSIAEYAKKQGFAKPAPKRTGGR